MYDYGLAIYPYESMEPPYGEPKAKYHCRICNSPLYIGDRMYLVDEKRYCEDCILGCLEEVE